MATFQVTAVRTEQSSGATHAHITHVGIGSDQAVLRRETVISDLRDPYGDRYYTNAGGKKADVIVAGCPRCTFSDYITTAPDYTTENNLLSLPRV
jgi:hypothetical protein